jgi:hypothetical protein
VKKRTVRLILGLSATTLALAAQALPAGAAGPNSFTLHLDCDNGQSYDIFVNDEHTVAAHVEGSTMIAVLKGGNGTGVPAFITGPHAGTLVLCETGIPGFTALVLFTPAGD